MEKVLNTTSAELKSRLRRLNLKAVKGLGQHFLIDRTVLETIISAAELGPEETVIEVGPGLGILTEQLLFKAKKVIAVEVDPRLVVALEQEFHNYSSLTVLNADILDLDIVDILCNKSPVNHDLPIYKVVANLPYYIASPVLRHFLEASVKPILMVIMVQKEVAQSIVAGPGKMSLLGVSVQLYGKPTIVDYITSTSFYPKPKVDSAIVRIDVYPKPAVDIDDISVFFDVVKAGFSTPRKQIHNSLSLGLQLPPGEVARLLEQAGISQQRRPQTLSLEEWGYLYSAFMSRYK